MQFTAIKNFDEFAAASEAAAAHASNFCMTTGLGDTNSEQTEFQNLLIVRLYKVLPTLNMVDSALLSRDKLCGQGHALSLALLRSFTSAK
eukprot:2751686-Pleurochrysis_carterae.AAC.1